MQRQWQQQLQQQQQQQQQQPQQQPSVQQPDLQRWSRRGLLTLSAATLLLPGAASAAGEGGGGGNVFLDVVLEGKPLGRIVIALEGSGVGTARFRDLCEEKEGVGYRLSKFDGIYPTYLRVNGVRSLSYSAFAESPIAGGDSTEALEAELAAQTQRHDRAGLVSLIVGEDPEDRPIKEKTVAKRGKLVTEATQQGEAPNGTAFTITRGAEPELDSTNLVVGRVVSGMEVLDTVAAQPFSKPREQLFDGPFFAVAKAMGDKRADTAEKGFYRPLKRIIIKNSGSV